MKEWQQIKLGKLITIKHGFAFKSDFFTDAGDYCLLTPGNFFERGGFRYLDIKQKYYTGPVPQAFVLEEGDLLVAMTEQAPGLLGSTAVIPEANMFLHNQRLGLIKIISERVGKRYLYHLFNSVLVRKPVSISAGGTKVRHTSPQKICDVVVPLPPIFIQQRIAEILSTWDRAVQKTEALIAAKEKRKKALMQQLLTGKRRFAEFIHNAEYRKTRYYPLPEDWQYVPIGEAAKEVSLRNGNCGDVPVLSCTKHQGLVDSLSYFGKQIYSSDTSNYKVVPRGAFAYATNHIEEGSIGFQDLYDKALISPIYTVFKTNDLVDDGFLLKLLKTEWYRHIFEVKTSSSVDRRGSLRWSDFSKIRIPVPSLAEQRKISETLDLFNKENSLLNHQLSALQEQKRGLMQQLLTGKTRVKLDA